MTKEEKEEIKRRLDETEVIERRMRYLKDAMAVLDGVTVTFLLIPVKADVRRIGYTSDRSPINFTDVRWSDKEEGLTEEIRLAVQNVIEARLALAEKTYESI